MVRWLATHCKNDGTRCPQRVGEQAAASPPVIFYVLGSQSCVFGEADPPLQLGRIRLCGAAVSMRG
jgi:hypothetical protein